MLAVSYSPLLVGASVVLAVMAGFTGLSLANGLSRLDASARKPVIVKAAIVLGGGVWSTHFVAMLAVQLPVAVFYDPLYTLASALIAILMAGAALLLLHFGERSDGRIAVAGVVMGLGVVVMHYIGMYGIRGCRPEFGLIGYVLSTTLAIAMSIGALRVAYGQRSLRGLILGGSIYGLAILTMHFSAMSQTGFLQIDRLEPATGLVSNDILALIVTTAAFMICGAFLLTTVTVRDQPAESPPMPEPEVKTAAPPHRLPYEQDGRTLFTPLDDVVAIQADGRYSRLHRLGGQVFCPIAINKLAEDLKDLAFLRTHRSYMVNLGYVQGFERKNDQGMCLFSPDLDVPPVPVSRANVPTIRKALGI